MDSLVANAVAKHRHHGVRIVPRQAQAGGNARLDDNENLLPCLFLRVRATPGAGGSSRGEPSPLTCTSFAWLRDCGARQQVVHREVAAVTITAN